MADFKYRGRKISNPDILYIRELIAAHPEASRRTLSTKLCEAWQWKQPNGVLRDMVCRGMLLMLDRAGQIALPPVSYVRHNPLAKRARPAPLRIDRTPIEARLRDLPAIEFQQVRRTADEPLFNSLMEEHHYLGYEQPVGEHLKYVVWAESRPLACLAWSSAPRHLGARDRYIGGSAEAQRSLSGLQHAFPDSAVGAGGAFSLASVGPDGGADLYGLAAHLRSSDLLCGNLCRSGALPRDLLPGGQLDRAGRDHRTRQAVQQLRAEPVD